MNNEAVNNYQIRGKIKSELRVKREKFQKTGMTAANL